MPDISPISVVLLAYNEAGVIESVVEGFMKEVVDRLPGSEFIIGEDGSTDGTSEILLDLAMRHRAIRLLQGKERKGYIRAFTDAMLSAKNDYILFCDASGKHDPADFWKMWSLMSDHDMVVGFKVHRKDPAYRIVLTRVFNWLVRKYYGIGLHDVNCPLRLMRKEAFATVLSDGLIQKELINFEITIRMIYRGYRVAEIPVQHFARTSGPSRGLPAGKIPSVVWKTLSNLKRLKKEAVRQLPPTRSR
jgi:glycosyltransferase involved in cell wall biosynthesis